MRKKIKLSTKKYADRFMGEKYDELANMFMALSDRPNCRQYPFDRLHDTVLSLYETDITFKSYKEFYKWANRKFTAKEERQ